jgi:hypothetical protein
VLRHSDIKLTAKVYTDESQLPVYDGVKGLPRLFDNTQIRAQISGGAGDQVSQAGEKGEGKRDAKHEGKSVSGRVLTLPVVLGQNERVKGIEPSHRANPEH